MLKTVVTTLILAGCSVGAVNGVGDDTPDPDGGVVADPRAATFGTDVTPIVTAKGCAAANCHDVTNPKLTSFTDMTGNGNAALVTRYLGTPSATNILITKDTIVAPIGMHQGAPYLDAAQKTTLSAWIDSGL